VLSEERQDVRRNADGAAARVGLGVCIECLGCLKQLDAVSADGDGAHLQVHVLGQEAEDLATAQAAPCGEKDGGPVSGRDGLDERGDLGR